MAATASYLEELLDRVAFAAAAAGLSERDLAELAAAVRRSPPSARALHREQARFIAMYFERFADGLSARAAVRMIQVEVDRYCCSAWRVDRRASGPPPAICGTGREVIWEILDRGALPSESTLRRIFAGSSASSI